MNIVRLVRLVHRETLRQAVEWLGIGDAFIADNGDLVVRLSGAGDAEVREPLHPDHLDPGVLRLQLTALAYEVASLPTKTDVLPWPTEAEYEASKVVAS